MQANELCLVGLHMCTMQNMLENCEKLMRNRGDGRSFLIKLCVQLYVKWNCNGNFLAQLGKLCGK